MVELVDRPRRATSHPDDRAGERGVLAFSSRYSEWNVITFARSPVIPKTTKTSAGRGAPRAGACGAAAGVAVVVISSSSIKPTGNQPSFESLVCTVMRRYRKFKQPVFLVELYRQPGSYKSSFWLMEIPMLLRLAWAA